MKLRIFRTSGGVITGPMITTKITKLKEPFNGISEMEFYYCDIPDLEHFLKLPQLFWNYKYNVPGEIILTIDSWTGEQAIEIYDDWRE